MKRPDDYRIVFELVRIEGKTHKEIAVQLGVSPHIVFVEM